MLIAGVECHNPVTSTLALLWRLPKYFLSFQLIVWVSFLPFPKIKTKQKRGEGEERKEKKKRRRKVREASLSIILIIQLVHMLRPIMYILTEPSVFQEHSGNVGGLDLLPARPPVQQRPVFLPLLCVFIIFPLA